MNSVTTNADEAKGKINPTIYFTDGFRQCSIWVRKRKRLVRWILVEQVATMLVVVPPCSLSILRLRREQQYQRHIPYVTIDRQHGHHHLWEDDNKT